MKLHFLLPVFFLLVCVSIVSSQVVETIKPPVNRDAQTYLNTKKTSLQTTGPRVSVDPKTVAQQKKWNITLTQHGVEHGNSVPAEVMDSIRLSESTLQQNHKWLLQGVEDTPPVDGLKVVTPTIQNGFKGNAYNGWAPSDNNIAVSDDGYVVSVINTNILFADISGNIIMEENMSDFLAVLNLNGNYFDPKLLYDPEEDKFILVVLNGNTPGTSTVVIGFSSTSNPNDSWWFYAFPGDPLGFNTWFDYPSIGISTNDLYISGNLFSADNHFNQVVIYQIDKGAGFTGGSVEYINWYDIRDANGQYDFSVVPVSYGFDGSLGPGIYFISTEDTGGTEATMHYTDNNVTNQPNFYTYNVTMENYYPPFSGLMLGTTDKIKTNDCKTLSAFYADGTIHFVFETRGDDFHTKVNYCRLNTADLTQKTLQFGLQPFEYAFPSVAPFSASNTDKSVLIGFLRTGGSIYPEFRVAAVDHDMNYSGSVLVKEGESFVDHDAGALERWGDYTGISRRHSANGVEIWVSGSYGEDNDNGSSNVLGTWIAQVTNGQIQAPVADFTSDVLNVSSGEAVNYMDMSINAPTSWQWTFEGGLPSTSTLQNPVIIYAEPGCYDVTLTASNAGGNNTMTKPCYIDVLTAVAEPDMVFNKFTVFPNPVTDERLNVEFEIEEPTVLDFFVVDSRGRVIKNILCRRVKGGLNTIAFNTDLLAPGAYYIAVRNAQNHLIKTEKFIVAQ